MQKVFPGLFLLLVLAALATPSYAQSEVFQKTYPLRAGGTFALSNVNGSVQVDGWDRDEVQIHAVKSARRDLNDLGRVSIEVEANANSVVVRTRYPQDESLDVSVDYRVRVPRRIVLNRVGTMNGAVRVTGVEGEGELRSVNGDVDLFDGAGRFSARTTNGSVRLEFHQLASEGVLSAETVNGSVILALPADANADLDLRSLNGSFRSELPVTMQSVVSSRELRGRLGQGGVNIRVRTVNGGIRVVTARPTI